MKKQDTILIVDDMEVNRAVLCELFRERHEVCEAENGRQAIDILRAMSDSIVIVLLDIMMPEMNGFDVLRQMRTEGLLQHTAVVLITGENILEYKKEGYELGVSDVIGKPFDSMVVMRRVENIIELYQHKNQLETMVVAQNKRLKQQAQKLKEYNNYLIDTLSTVVEFRSMESGKHIMHIRTLAKTLLEYVSACCDLGYGGDTIEAISSASVLHDVGKITIPDSILLKPGKLSVAEFEIMKTHTTRGCEILNSLEAIKDETYYKYCYDICRFHHERWDGNGYPDGLKGTEIPIWAQVVSIADIYDALVSERVYKAAFSHETAMKMIFDGECGAFSPDLLNCLLLAQNRFKQISSDY